jgi:predicted transcriptional regulator
MLFVLDFLVSHSQKRENKTDIMMSILEIITQNPRIKIPEIATVLEGTVERTINKLKRIGPDKGGYWQMITKQKD